MTHPTDGVMKQLAIMFISAVVISAFLLQIVWWLL